MVFGVAVRLLGDPVLQSANLDGRPVVSNS